MNAEGSKVMKKAVGLVISFLTILNVHAHIADIESLPSTSQYGQDTYILTHFFPDRYNGVFIEFGADDGYRLSNTYVLEKYRGWTGLCIEPLPHRFELLKKNRSCVCIHGCVAPQEGQVTFRVVEGEGELLSGIENEYDPRHRARIAQEAQSWRFIEVPTYRLSRLMKDHNITSVDFLSIDTEGGELGIIQSLSDEELSHIDVICIEDNYGDSEITQFLESKGFAFITRIHCDLIFRNQKYLDH